MKKIILAIVSVIVSMSVNAQVVKVYQNNSLSATYTNSTDHAYKVVFEEAPDPNLLSGKFSVSATKQVQFTKSNLYWDGSDYMFEANQTDYPTSWNTSHVGHFFWSNITDYQSGTTTYMPYAESYSYSKHKTSDKFWCGEENPLTVEGLSDLYALTRDEWSYLINSRTNASSLCKGGVTVTNGGTSYQSCMIIAPDDFTGTLQSSYTLDQVNAAGLVCLPAAGCREGNVVKKYGGYSYYWSATCSSINEDNGYYLNSSLSTTSDCRYCGFSIRLVRNLGSVRKVEAVKIYDKGELKGTYANSSTNPVKVAFEEGTN